MAAQCATVECSPIRACWLRAWDRAKAEQLIPYRNTDGTWSVKTYTVTVTGPGWSNLSCDCPAGSHNRVCKHLPPVAKCIAMGVSPIRGSARGDDPFDAAFAGVTCEHGTPEGQSCTACYVAAHPLPVDTDEEPAFAEQEEEAEGQRFGPDPVNSRHLALTAARAARLAVVPPATWIPSGANDGFTRLVIADPLQSLWS